MTQVIPAPPETPPEGKKKFLTKKKTIIGGSVIAGLLVFGGINSAINPPKPVPAAEETTVTPEPEVGPGAPSAPPEAPVPVPNDVVVPEEPTPEQSYTGLDTSKFDLPANIETEFIFGLAEADPRTIPLDHNGMIELAKQTCVLLDQGAPLDKIITTLTAGLSPVEADTAKSVMAYGAGFFCPDLSL